MSGPLQPRSEVTALAARVWALTNIELPRVRGNWYHHQAIELDGYRFEGCRFDNCALVTRLGAFVMDRCKIADCQVLYFDGAVRVVNLYNVSAREWIQRWPGLGPTFNPDLTISIGMSPDSPASVAQYGR